MKTETLIKKFLSIMDNPKMCYNADPSKKVSAMIYAKSIEDAVAANEAGSDVYFYINGGPKEGDVKNFKFCYIDLDAGRDSNGRYFDTKKVASLKVKMLKRIEEFSLAPSLIVETRNGYQVYWRITQTPLKDLWSGVESRLVSFFASVGADKRTIKPNQLYRVPFTFWQKKTEGKLKFFCKIEKQNTKTYDLSEFKKVFKDLNVPAHSRLEDGVAEALTISYKKPWAAPAKENTSTLIHNVIDFLDQIQGPLSYSKNKFLATCAKELALRLSNEYCTK